MTVIPCKPDSLEKLAQFVWGKYGIAEFEKWLYSASDLEQEIGEDAYLQLISFDYRLTQEQFHARRVAACAVAQLAPAFWTRSFEIDRQRVKDEIRAAFSGVSRGDGTTLHEARVKDDRGNEEQIREARKLDTDSTWEDVPASEISDYPSTLHFLDTRGFLYYIPAFMVWTLAHLENGLDADSAHTTVFVLTHSPVDDERLSAFTRDQVVAVCHFLWHAALADDYNFEDICAAIEIYTG